MTSLERRKQAAIEAVAKRFSVPWQKGDSGEADTCLTIADKRIAVDIAAISQTLAESENSAKPRLRFDKVALRLVARLQISLSKFVPDGNAVIVTVTAPIRLASKTTAMLESLVWDCFTRPSLPVEIKDTIHGNQVRIRFVKGVLAPAEKVIGFVHNPDSDADILLNLTQSLLLHVGTATASPRSEELASERWLVLACAEGPTYIETYRQAYLQSGISSGFQKILMVFADGQVEPLTN
ncbi:hypothetical protein HB779_09575 [Phyllobacterium sp. 628]|uniref:hypothetical protein n=1 Tax=Phyllobacterium sp. 628 TaxID=2718938 RepID=UPI00166230C0|nr:hypothetical protein [Phyllobacterium sp. 628]QND52130.1 hypothetical protein HB779_09575 [Phyllobacterium sp. 628]